MKQKIQSILKKEQPYLMEDLKLILCLAVVLFLMHFSGIGCPFRFFFGVPCAGCGMSRAVLALMQGHTAEAIRLHPLCILLPFAAAAWLFRRHIPDKYWKPMLSLFIAVFLVTYFIRLLSQDPMLPVHPADGFLMHMIKEVKNVLS